MEKVLRADAVQPETFISDLRASKLTRMALHVPDEKKGTFAWIEKERLHVDHTYQRDFKPRRVALIAPRFSWPACGTLSVVRRKDGSLFIFEGQHRHGAAMLRNDITHLPCLIFEDLGLAQEAKAFHVVQTARSAVKAVEQHRARVIFGDPDAMFLDEVIGGSGYKVTGNPGNLTLRCVGAAMRCIELDRAAFRGSWPLICALHQGASIHSEALEGIWYLYKHTNGAVTINPLRERLLRLSLREALEWISKAKSYYIRGGPKVYARGLANFLNQRTTAHRILFNEDDA